MEVKPLMSSKTIVIKLGTSVLTGGSQHLDRAHMVELVRQCALLHKQGHKVIVVTSGAIAAGREHLGFPDLPSNVLNKQMLAAVGQSQLILTWENLFNIYGLHVGQMLLTGADLNDKERYLYAKELMSTFLNHRIIPIVNENDAVAVAEIKYGDNDNLSARVAMLAEADLLLLLTDQRGLFSADPRTNPDAELIEEVDTIDDALRALAGGSAGGLGTGGMATKLQAADIATRAGIEVVIASGQAPEVITRVGAGESVGTRFPALLTPLDNRKEWILVGRPPEGRIRIDKGAVQAVRSKGSSLLPKGVYQVKGKFSRGEVVTIESPAGKALAQGVCRYSSAELEKILGLHSEEIEACLGYSYGAVVVHRDYLVVL